ncbi:MAG: molybdopterin biosynthesis protein [Oscillospiraceae bacterium]|nr:molybdopterin biosynthesis protein [Oscillospiraceae bacterium]
MAFTYLTNLPLEKARQEYPAWLSAHGLAPRTEVIPVQAACRRVTAKAVYAQCCAPHYPACAMDGIAVQAGATFGASETTPVRLFRGQYTVVDTGDLLPEPCDAVIMAEELLWEGDSVLLHAAAIPWQHVRQVGEDICAGEMLLPSRTPITPAALGAMLAGGVFEVEVFAKPVVGILPTGDEVVPPTQPPQPGQVPEFNSAIFSALLEEWGALPQVYPIIKDNQDRIKAALVQAASQCDMVLLNAGSSAGREDFSAGAIGSVGEVFCHGVAMQPGKPVILGRRGDRPVIGVPGYPVSGILVLEQFVQPLVALLTGSAQAEAPVVTATLARGVVSGLKHREFVRVRLGTVGERLIAAPLARGSGMVTSFLKADGLLEIPQETEGYSAGAQVPVRLLRPPSELTHTLVAVGSHDPLLDELADLLHTAHPDCFLRSSHVGSMGGIMALRRGEAHLAGCHLLDETDGHYNASFLKRYFPKGGIYQVECVGRLQGLMLAAGNPKGLRKFADLAQPGLRYINRQKGSGTRILADYLCRTDGVDSTAVQGYEREAFTHTAVAAQIASGTADAGLGIFSAAELYGLDFLPICVEQYDLLVPASAWNTPLLRALLDCLKSGAFRARLLALGGYTVEQPGRVRMQL